MNVNIQSTSDSLKPSLLQKGGGAVASNEPTESKGFFAALTEAFGMDEKSVSSEKPQTKELRDSDTKSNQATHISTESELDDAAGDDVVTSSDSENVSEESELTAVSEEKSTSETKLLSGEAQPSDTKSTEVKSAEAKSVEAKSVDVKSPDLKASEVKSSNAQEVLDHSKVSQKADVPVEVKGDSEGNSTPSVADEKGAVASKEASQVRPGETESVEQTKVAAVMDEGNQLLGRLDEANKTLQPENGNSLPQPDNMPAVNESYLADLKQLESLIAKSDVEPLSEQELATVEALSNKIAIEEEAMLSAGTLFAAQKQTPRGLEGELNSGQYVEIETSPKETVAQEIQWGNVAPIEPKLDGALAAKGALSSSVHHALNQQQAQAAQSLMADSAIAEKALNEKMALDKAVAGQLSTQQSIAADATALTGTAQSSAAASKSMVSEAALASALGAGVVGATRKSSSQEASDTFAQQIAAASGQPGAVTPAQARAEIQAAQQVPLQLTKELANEQVQEKIQMMMSKNLKNLDIRLDPPELGRMQIRMTMNNDMANVHFTVSNPQARDIIEQTLPRLREMLAQQGLQLADSSVQQQSSGQQQASYDSSGSEGSSGFGANNDQNDENFDTDVKLDLNVTTKRDGISYYA